MIALELGSGASPTMSVDGMEVVHLDRVEGPHVELVADLEHGIPLPSSVVNVVLALDVLEHVPDVVGLMDEVHRVLVPDGTLYIRAPVWGGPWHRIDPTHVRGFDQRSFDFFDDSTDLGRANGRLYTPRRWTITARAEANHNVLVTMRALKPGETAGHWGLRL